MTIPPKPVARDTAPALAILPQPDDTTCGPTSLHAVYRHYGDDVSLQQVIDEVEELPDGGTLGVMLALHALRRGYRADIYTYNLQLFDPTWFEPAHDLADCLRLQMAVKPDTRLQLGSEAYLRFLAGGGRVRFAVPTRALLRRLLARGEPVLTGLSATYLYACARERNDRSDPIGGEPVGHFVVLTGYQRVRKQVVVTDPFNDNPGFGVQRYEVHIDRLIAAILLGIVSYDANLVVLRPNPRALHKPRRNAS